MAYIEKPTSTGSVPTGAFWPFVALAFGLSWGIVAVLIFFNDWVLRVFGAVSASNPLFILAVYAPAIAGVSLVFWFGGIAGVMRFARRLVMWRAGAWWWLLLVLGIPALFAAGAAVKGNLFPLVFPFDGMRPMVSAMLFMLVLGPMEEIGWRGVALPLLQRRMAPIWAALLLGVIWGVWHLPAFFLSGTPQSNWSFLPFFVGAVSLSVIITPMFNASRGSIQLPILFHFQLNNPLWPDAQPYDTLFFAMAAVVIVLANRDSLFARGAATTQVIPD